MAQRREDMMGKTPQIGDTIIYNPPRYKGLEKMICVGFAKSGLPILVKPPVYANTKYSLEELASKYAGCTPKTGFVIVKREYE